MNRRLWLIAAAVAAFTVLAAACGGQGSTTGTAPVVEAPPPWSGAESYTYQLSMRGQSDAGQCILKTEPSFEPGRTRLSRLCGKDQYRDDGALVVEAATLRPLSSQRTVVDGQNNRKTVYTTTYQDGQVLFLADINGKPKETVRSLPSPTPEAPTPAWYDDESLLWLARSIPLRQGYQGRYAHVINAGQPRILTVDVSVERIEPAGYQGGQADAWRVEFRRDTTTYTVWVELQAPYRVLRAQIEDVTYRLVP